MLTETAMSCGLCGHLLQDLQKPAAQEAAALRDSGGSEGGSPLPTTEAVPVTNAPQMPQTHTPVGVPNYMLEEYRRQYMNLTYIQMAGALGVFTGLLALALVAWAIIHKPNLRAKVAAMGVDPQEWAAPMDALFWRVVLWAVAAYVGCAVIGLIVWGVVALFQANS